MKHETKPIFSKEFDNKIILNVFDRSRITAGDRWYVELECIATVPISKSIIDNASKQLNPRENIQGKMPKELTHSSKMTRHFIAGDEKEAVQKEMMNQIQSTILAYLAKPSFPEKLFRLEMAKQRQQDSNKIQQVLPTDQVDDAEPTDFSHCFRD